MKNEYSKIVNVFGNTLSLLNAPLLETWNQMKNKKKDYLLQNYG